MNGDMNPNITQGQTGAGGFIASPAYPYQGGCQTTFQQLASNQNLGRQPAPMQTLPLYLQQQPMQQPFMQQQPMQQQIQPTSQIVGLPTIMGQGSPPRETPSVVAFTDFEQLSVLSDGIPLTAESLQYLNGFLRTQIGRRVRVEFLIGTSSFIDKEGILLGVGVNYILINETDTDDLTACDFYNIKFIKFYY